jgi:hypothetical protein
VAAAAIEHGRAIEVGALITVAPFVVAFPVLALLRAARRREEGRYERR